MIESFWMFFLNIVECDSLRKDIEKLIESKTRLTKNHVFYDLVTVSELQQILNGDDKK